MEEKLLVKFGVLLLKNNLFTNFIKFAIICSFVIFIGCNKATDEQKTHVNIPTNEYLVQMGSKGFTKEEFEDYLTYRPFPSHVGKISEEMFNSWLEEVTVSELLYQEALNHGLDNDPVFKRQMRSILTQKLIEIEVEQPVWNMNISDDEIKDFFDKHEQQFNRPAEVRIADIFIAVENKSEKDIKQKQAKQILIEAKGVEGKKSGFGSLIQKYSDKHDNYPLGDTGYFSKTGKPANVDKKLVDTSFQLKVGEIADHLIETSKGFHIIMLVGKRPAMKTSWEKKKHQIEQLIKSQKLETGRKEFIAQLKESSNIQRNEKNISEYLNELNQKQNVDTKNKAQGDLEPPALPR